jgi:hypothetical protein
MAYPAEGIETAYRNSMEEVAGMLDCYHYNHYFIFNLTERGYDAEKLHNRVGSLKFNLYAVRCNVSQLITHSRTLGFTLWLE